MTSEESYRMWTRRGEVCRLILLPVAVLVLVLAFVEVPWRLERLAWGFYWGAVLGMGLSLIGSKRALDAME